MAEENSKTWSMKHAQKLGSSVDQGPRDASLAFNPNAEVAHRNVGTTTLCFMLPAGYTGPLMKYWPIIDDQS